MDYSVSALPATARRVHAVRHGAGPVGERRASAGNHLDPAHGRLANLPRPPLSRGCCRRHAALRSAVSAGPSHARPLPERPTSPARQSLVRSSSRPSGPPPSDDQLRRGRPRSSGSIESCAHRSTSSGVVRAISTFVPSTAGRPSADSGVDTDRSSHRPRLYQRRLDAGHRDRGDEDELRLRVPRADVGDAPGDGRPGDAERLCLAVIDVPDERPPQFGRVVVPPTVPRRAPGRGFTAKRKSPNTATSNSGSVDRGVGREVRHVDAVGHDHDPVGIDPGVAEVATLLGRDRDDDGRSRTGAFVEPAHPSLLRSAPATEWSHVRSTGARIPRSRPSSRIATTGTSAGASAARWAVTGRWRHKTSAFPSFRWRASSGTRRGVHHLGSRPNRWCPARRVR